MEVTDHDAAEPSFESAIVSVTTASDVGNARRRAAAVCGRMGFDETRAGAAAIVVTEIANNVVTHGGGGEIALREIAGAREGLEILAYDRGPGIRNVEEARRDGHSTGGTPGTGLGAIARLADEFDLYAQVDRGTALVARVWTRPSDARQAPQHFEASVVCVPKPGEAVAGDAWSVTETPGGVRILVVDGLGHGPLAREAAALAVKVAAGLPRTPLAGVAEACHQALRATRGAALALADVDLAARAIDYVGIGNIAGVVGDGRARQSLVSMNGTAGHPPVAIRVFRYAWPAGALLTLASDGLTTRWNLDAYPGLALHDPALVVGVLYRDHRRGTDDATVLALRERRLAVA